MGSTFGDDEGGEALGGTEGPGGGAGSDEMMGAGGLLSGGGGNTSRRGRGGVMVPEDLGAAVTEALNPKP